MSEEDRQHRSYLLRFRIGVALLAVLAIPAAFHSHAAIESLFNHPADWVPDSVPVKAEFNHFVDHFTASDLIMLAWEGSDLDSPQLELMSRLMRPLCSEDYDASTDAETLSELPEWGQEQIAAIRQRCGMPAPFLWARTGTETLEQLTSQPVSLPRRVGIARLQGSLVGPDEEQTCMVISFRDETTPLRRYLIPQVRSMASRVGQCTVDDVAVVGGPFEGATVDDASIRSIRVFSPPSAVLAAILCFICLRSFALTAATVAVAVIGEGLVLAAVYYWGVPMNAILIVLPPLVFVLTVSAGIHLSNYYLDAAHEFPELTRAQAAQRAMKAGVAPCVLAAGTTVIGLSSLMLVRLEPVRIFGGVASLGVMLTLGLLFLIIPGAMVLTKPRRGPDSDAEEFAAPRRWAGTWMRRRLASPWPLITAFLLVAVGLSLGLTQLNSSVNISRMFLPDSDIRRHYAWFEEHIGPTITGDVLLIFPPMTDEEDSLDRLELVKNAHLSALSQDGVDGVLSSMSFVPGIPRQRSFGASARRGAIRELIRDPESSLGRLGFISRDDTSEVWRLNIRMPQKQADDYRPEIDRTRAAVAESLKESDVPVEVRFTGQVAIVQASQDILLRDLFRSFIAAFGIIAVVMILMLRNVGGGLIAMLPNLFPTVALFGLMGLLGVPLDIGSVMSASVALGIAVDDTVHLLSRYGSRRARGLGQIRAAYGALAQCGWAMFQTTLVCGLSLMVYWFSDFVPTSRFSLFMFGLLAAALLGVVFLLPTLMSTPFGRWLSRPVGASPEATLYHDNATEKPRDIRRLPTRWQRRQRQPSDSQPAGTPSSSEHDPTLR